MPEESAWVVRREAMLARYMALLTEADSPLLQAGDEVVTQVQQQFNGVVEEATGQASPSDGTALSSQIGRQRASRGIHPSQSLAAANMIFAASLEGLAEHFEEAGVAAPLEHAARRLNAVILARMAEAASGYVDYLLEKSTTAHLDEAKRLSRQLHDQVGPSVAVGLQALELIEVYLAEDPGKVVGKIRDARESLLAASTLVRSLAAETRQTIEPGELAAALQRHLAMLPGSIRGGFACEGDLSGLPVHSANEIFLILREAMRNAVSHGEPSEVTLDIQIGPAHLVGIVTDDGDGFDAEKVASGTGLTSMRERAAMLGADLAISSEPSQTRVMLTVPLARREPR